MSNTAILRIVRSGPGLAEETETFTVPYETGASVLDGLIWLRENRDPSLAFRYSCTNANVCKECTMRIDGETALRLHGPPQARRHDARALAQQAGDPRPGDRHRPPRRKIRERLRSGRLAVPDGAAAFRLCLYPEPAPPLDRATQAAA